MKKLCICIPTYNRPDCIDYILKCSVNWVKEYDIYFYICDSSTNGKTNDIVRKYASIYGERLIYDLETNYPDKTSDLKVMRSFQKLCNKYEYIHLSGDGFVVDIPSCMKYLKKAIDSDFDVIHFNNHRYQISTEYSSGKDFVSENGWFATCYGATVLSSKLIRKSINDSNLELCRNTGFLFWYSMLCGIASNNEKIITYNAFPLINNPYKPTNSSYQAGKFINFWIVGWSQIIDMLPDFYNEVKNKLKKDAGLNMHLYTWANLLRLRATSNLEWKNVKERRRMISQVTDVPYWHFVIVSFIPKSLIKVAKCIKGRLKCLFFHAESSNNNIRRVR